LVVTSAFALWGEAVVLLLISGVALIHPVVIAIRYRERPGRRYNRWWFYLLWTVVAQGALITLVVYRASLLGYEPFRTPTSSMSPTIEQGDLFMVDTWRYKRHPPAIGEIVVFERPDRPGAKYVKRIVGLSGDQIEAREGVLYRNGQAVPEPYTHALVSYHPYGRDFGPTLVRPGNMFVLGDYRDNSLDSREWGPMPISQLHGRAQFIWLTANAGSVKLARVGISLEP
jgi:signal peptidase I